MTREQQYNAAYARARAADRCAAVVGVEVQGVGIPHSIKDKAVYRNEVKMILDDLNCRAAACDVEAEILKPTEQPTESD